MDLIASISNYVTDFSISSGGLKSVNIGIDMHVTTRSKLLQQTVHAFIHLTISIFTLLSFCLSLPSLFLLIILNH